MCKRDLVLMDPKAYPITNLGKYDNPDLPNLSVQSTTLNSKPSTAASKYVWFVNNVSRMNKNQVFDNCVTTYEHMAEDWLPYAIRVYVFLKKHA